MIKLDPEWPSEDEVQKIVDWLNDKTLMKYSEQRHHSHSPDSQYEYIEDMKNPPCLYWIIRGPNRMIGTVSAFIDKENSVADAGILIGSEYTGKGYGVSGWGALCDALAKMGVRKIEGGCMAQNKAMLRIFEKNGMRLEGTRRYHFQTGKDQYDDMVLYGKLT